MNPLLAATPAAETKAITDWKHVRAYAADVYNRTTALIFLGFHKEYMRLACFPDRRLGTCVVKSVAQTLPRSFKTRANAIAFMPLPVPKSNIRNGGLLPIDDLSFQSISTSIELL